MQTDRTSRYSVPLYHISRCFVSWCVYFVTHHKENKPLVYKRFLHHNACLCGHFTAFELGNSSNSRGGQVRICYVDMVCSATFNKHLPESICVASQLQV